MVIRVRLEEEAPGRRDARAAVAARLVRRSWHRPAADDATLVNDARTVLGSRG